MANRKIAYRKGYNTERYAPPITITPAHWIGRGYDGAVSGDDVRKSWWVEVPAVSESDGGFALNESEMRALATAIEAALDDMDRSVDGIVKRHNNYIEKINKQEAK